MDLKKYLEYEKSLYERFNLPHIRRVMDNSGSMEKTGSSQEEIAKLSQFSELDVVSDSFALVSKRLQEWEFTPKGMFIIGNSGSGKTELMKSFRRMLATEERFASLKAYYWEYEVFINKMQTFEKEGAESFFNHAMSADVLIIDDFANGHLGASESKITSRILNTRLNTQKPLFMTCNLGPAELKEKIANERITDRILELGLIVRVITDESYRRKIQKQQRKEAGL